MPNGKRRSGVRPGFTLIELLVVVGIILVLLGILLPVANRIIAAAHKTDTSAEIAKLATAIQFYFTTNGSYPGPIPESKIWGFNTSVNQAYTEPPANSFVYGETDITSSENLLLGLIGGLVYPTATSNTPPISYDVTQITNANGPSGLNPLTPQRFPAYVDFVKAEISQDPATGVFVSWAQANKQTGISATLDIPEFVDHFPNPRPIIYLRARVGGSGGAPADVLISSAAPTGSPWYSMEMSPYWIVYNESDNHDVSFKPTPNQYNLPFPSTPIGTLSTGTTLVPLWPPYLPPYGPSKPSGEVSFFQNQTLQDNITPRSNGSFILISAGADGIFGTQDDIIYSN